MRPAALILCALVVLAGTARADAPDGGAPVVLDGGAVDVPSVDGGDPLPPPAQLHAGDPAPFDGWELSDTRARLLAVNADQQAKDLADCQNMDAPVGVKAFVVVSVAALVLGFAAGAAVVALKK